MSGAAAAIRRLTPDRLLLLGLPALLVVLTLHFIVGCPGADSSLARYGSALHAGDSVEQARAKAEGCWCLRVSGSPGGLTVSTPYRLGAGNWYLYLRFDDAGLSSMHYRNEDNNTPLSPPPGAPPDWDR